MLSKIMGALGLLAFAMSCADDTGFRAEKAADPVKVETPQQSSDQVAIQPVSTVVVEAEAEDGRVDDAILADSELSVVAATYQYGEPDPKVDYLFVVDNSVSMLSIIELVNAGFQAILNQNVFSPDSQVAVMSTMIADANNFAVTGLGISRYTGIDFEPGFLDFVNKDAIAKYRLESPGNAAKWAMDGCQQKWFKPEDKDGMGNYCLSAALQSTYSAVGAEPGIHAFEQLLLKNAANPVFRPEALVNVIFVSDTHDPGRNVQELIDSIKTYQQLTDLAKVANNMRSLKFHAIAPAEKCTGENLYDRSYYTLVDASQGTKGDSCTLTDYTEFMKTMVAASQKVEPVFALEKPANEVIRVLVNDQEINDFQVADDKMSIKINGLDPKKAVSISILYAQ